MYTVYIEQLHPSMFRVSHTPEPNSTAVPCRHRLSSGTYIGPELLHYIGKLNTVERPRDALDIYHLLYRPATKDDTHPTYDPVKWTHAYTAVEGLCGLLNIDCPSQAKLNPCRNRNTRHVPLYVEETK